MAVAATLAAKTIYIFGIQIKDFAATGAGRGSSLSSKRLDCSVLIIITHYIPCRTNASAWVVLNLCSMAPLSPRLRGPMRTR